MATTTMHNVGDTVHIDRATSAKYAGTYRVSKINPTTYILSNDQHPTLKAPHGMVGAGTPDTGDAAVVPVESFQPGAVVTLRGVRGADPARLFVVTGSVPKGYRVFPLGGSDRYYTGVPAAKLVRIATIDGWAA